MALLHGEKDRLEISLTTRTQRRHRERDGVALYRSAADEHGSVGLFCSGLGIQRISRTIADRVLADHAVVFVDDGEGWLETDATGRQHVAAPALFWLQPGARHGYGPADGSSWHEHWVLFRGPLADGLVAAGLFDPQHPVLSPSDATELVDLFGVLHSDFLDDDPLGPAGAAADLHRLLVRAARLARSAARRDRQGRFDEAVTALRQRAFADTNLATLAREFGLSPATFRRQMLAAHGVAPKTFLLQLRSARAKELLAVTELSIAAVAAQVGFDDPYYFSRIFAVREGMPPSEFRRRNQRG